MHPFICTNQRVILLLAYLGQLLLSVSQFALTIEVTKSEGNNSSHHDINSGHVINSDSKSQLVEVKIGFLVGSRRLDRDHTYSRPGRQLKYAFNYAIDKFNQFNTNTYNPNDDYDATSSSSAAAAPPQVNRKSSASSVDSGSASELGIKIKFVPIIRETFGSESESIKQTIELITKHDVKFIFGPQETCKTEPKLASIFNVAMLSHYCTTWTTNTQAISSSSSSSSSPSSSFTSSSLSSAGIAAKAAIVTDTNNGAGGGGGGDIGGKLKSGINKQQSNVLVAFGGAAAGDDPGHPSSSKSSMISQPMTTIPVKTTTTTTTISEQRQSQSNQQQRQRSTFIQIKPPHWKIVSRVLALIEHLLSVAYSDNNGNKHTLYPQQLVLLYFKELPPSPTSSKQQQQQQQQRQQHEQTNTGFRSDFDYDFGSSSSSSYSSLSSSASSNHLNTAANDAVQYRLIGELLEIKLNELIADRRRKLKQKQKSTSHHHHRQPPLSLSALNWHTTFHYGYTKNPFRAVLRKHLFQRHQNQSPPIANQSASISNQWKQQQCLLFDSDNNNDDNKSPNNHHQFAAAAAPNSRVLPRQPEAIYIVVGHYYEHLGLMLALNELNLLPTTTTTLTSAGIATTGIHDDQQQPTGAASASAATVAQESIQSSVGRMAANMMMMMRRQQRRSVVIGVDTEPYDERDDSVRFLRGLLMDSVIGGSGSGGQSSSSSSPSSSSQPADDLDLDSISNLYRAYLGVVPAKPTHLAEFLEEMRSLHMNETTTTTTATLSFPSTSSSSSSFSTFGDSIHELPTTLTAAEREAEATATSNSQIQQQQQQQQQLQLNARLLQFIRLPVEAFYLYDAVMLLGLYLKDCLLKWKGSPNRLVKCSQGDRTFEWFRDRDYVSHVTHNWSRFDSYAQADGSYNLITRRKQTSTIDLATAAAASNSLNNQDEDSNSSGGGGSASGSGSSSGATLIPIGYFSGSTPIPSGSNVENSTFYNSTNANSTTTTTTTIDSIGLYLSSSSWDEVDPIWLPFWCHVRKDFTSTSACLHLFQAIQDVSSNSSSQMDHEDHEQLDPNASIIGGSYPSLTIVIALLLLMLMLLSLYLVYDYYNFNDGDDHHHHHHGRYSLRSKNFNAGWFSESDEKNFLDLIYKYLLNPEASNSSGSSNNSIGNDNNETTSLVGMNEDNEEQQQSVPTPTPASPSSTHQRRDMLELHCNMFTFPSCMFVHWLTAMHQLKDMLFKFKSTSQDDTEIVKSAGAPPSDERDHFTGIIQFLIKKSITGSQQLSSTTFGRQFFSIKHPGTNSLRLLLNKYKAINECLINLVQLDHEAVAKLHGITMSCTVAAAAASTKRTVYLILERPDRGNLRQAIKQSNVLGGSCPSQGFGENGHDRHQLLWLNFKKDFLIDSLLGDLLDGLEFLHNSLVGFHGDLRSTTCHISYNWRLKLSGFHTNHLRRSLGCYEQKTAASMQDSQTDTYFDQLIYSAPEIIQNHTRRNSMERETIQLADIYSFAFVAYELLSDGLEPWTSCTTVRNSKLIVERVRDDASFRPALSKLDNDLIKRQQVFDLDGMQRTIRSCWSHSPERRPQSIALLRARIGTGMKCRKAAIRMDTNELMRIYTGLIERSCYNQRKYLKIVRRQIMNLELRLLPANIVLRLRQKQPIFRQRFDCVSFAMFRLVLADGDESQMLADPLENLGIFIGKIMKLVDQYRNHLHLLDSQADSLMRFMVYSGEPLIIRSQQEQQHQHQQHLHLNPQHPTSSQGFSQFNSINHAQLVASFALQLVDLAARSQASGNPVQVRCGLHCGPVFGGLLDSSSVSADNGSYFFSAEQGFKRGDNLARYILIGSTMQVANTLEQTSQPQRIQISPDFRAQLLLNERTSMALSSSSSILSFSQASPQGTAAIEMGGHNLDRCRQGYVIIKRGGEEARVKSTRLFYNNTGSTIPVASSEFESYWLLNGPKLTASQSLMLLTRSACDSPPTKENQCNENSRVQQQCRRSVVDESDDDSTDQDDDWHQHWAPH